MKTTHFFKLLFIIPLLLHLSCSSDNDDDSNQGTQNNDISISVDEYPSSGTFLSAIETDLSGDVDFNITSQTSGLALIITNNQLAVGDWLAFDYETNQTLIAVIEASNGTETETINVTVTINNVDDIWAFLSGDTRTAYEDASPGEWVWIRESEYNDLANYLTDTSKSGATDNQLFNGGSVQNVSGSRTFANANGNTMPSNDYFFAFKYYSWSSNAASNRVKLSETSAESSFSSVGEILPEHDDGFNHFVLKGVSSKTTSEAYVGLYASVSIGAKNDNSSNYNYGGGNTATLDDTVSGMVLLQQGLSTSLKQWD